jgi:hypothetical protein
MGRILVLSFASFSMALGAVAGLDAYTAKWPSAAQAVWIVASERTHAPRPPRACCGRVSARNATPADPFRSSKSAALGDGALASTLAGGDGPPGADPPRPQRRTP